MNIADRTLTQSLLSDMSPQVGGTPTRHPAGEYPGVPWRVSVAYPSWLVRCLNTCVSFALGGIS